VGIGQPGDPFEGIAGRFGILDLRYRLVEEFIFGIAEEVTGRRIDLRDEKRCGCRIAAEDAGAVRQFVRKSVQEPGFDGREKAAALLADKAGNQFTQAGGQPAFFGRESGVDRHREIVQDEKADGIFIEGENDQAAVFARNAGEEISLPGAGTRKKLCRGLKRRAGPRDGGKEFVVEGHGCVVDPTGGKGRQFPHVFDTCAGVRADKDPDQPAGKILPEVGGQPAEGLRQAEPVRIGEKGGKRHEEGAESMGCMEQSIIPVSLAERLVTYAVVFHEACSTGISSCCSYRVLHLGRNCKY